MFLAIANMYAFTNVYIPYRPLIFDNINVIYVYIQCGAVITRPIFFKILTNNTHGSPVI